MLIQPFQGRAFEKWYLNHLFICSILSPQIPGASKWERYSTEVVTKRLQSCDSSNYILKWTLYMISWSLLTLLLGITWLCALLTGHFLSLSGKMTTVTPAHMLMQDRQRLSSQMSAMFWIKTYWPGPSYVPQTMWSYDCPACRSLTTSCGCHQDHMDWRSGVHRGRAQSRNKTRDGDNNNSIPPWLRDLICHKNLQ